MTSSKEVNSQFAIFDESETQYIKTSMKFVTFPFSLEQKADPQSGRLTMSAYLFSPRIHPNSPIQLKDIGWDRKEHKSAQILNVFPKNCETIIEEPTLEIQETDHEAAIRDSGSSTNRLKSTSELEDKSRNGSSKRLHLQSNKSLPSVKDGATPSDQDEEARSKVKSIQPEEMPPSPFRSPPKPRQELRAVSKEIMDPLQAFSQSERTASPTDRVDRKVLVTGMQEHSPSAFLSTLNQLRSLRQKYCKNPNSDIGRSISPKTIELVKKQLHSTLRSRTQNKGDSPVPLSLSQSTLLERHPKSEPKNSSRRVYKSNSVNIRKSPTVLPMAVPSSETTPEFRGNVQQDLRAVFTSKLAKLEKEGGLKPHGHETESFSFGQRISNTTTIDGFAIGNQVEGIALSPSRPRMPTSHTNRHNSMPEGPPERKSQTESVLISKTNVSRCEVQEDSISISTLQRIFGNTTPSNIESSNTLRYEKGRSGLFKKISQKKAEPKMTKANMDRQDTNSSLLLSQMLEKVVKSRSSTLKDSNPSPSDFGGESPQNIRMVFNNLFVDGIANISLGEGDNVAKTPATDTSFPSKPPTMKPADSEKPSQKRVISEFVHCHQPSRHPSKAGVKKGASQQLESSKSSADKSIRSATQHSCDTNKTSYVKCRKKTIGTTADLASISKSGPKPKTYGVSSGPNIQNKSEKNLKTSQVQLDQSFDQNHSRNPVPMKNSKFSSHIYPGGNHPKTVLLEDTDKSCAAIRQKVKDLLDPKLKGTAETPTGSHKRVNFRPSHPVTSHKIAKGKLNGGPSQPE